MRQAILFIASGTALLTLGACDRDRPVDPVMEAGRALYEQHCAACHSIEGQGSIFKDYPALKGTALETLDIVHRVTATQAQNRKMPLFTDLSEADALQLARAGR